MRDIAFYALTAAALLYMNASPLAWSILAIGIIYAFTITAYTRHKGGS